MAKFVLIHGASHGAWCWYKIAAKLRATGHEVITPDLPGHGIDRTQFSLVSMRAYVDAVVQVVQSQNEPVILVGHSLGGLVIPQVAEEIPTQIRRVVYLAAPVLQSGESMMTVMGNEMEVTMGKYTTMDEQGLLHFRLNEVKDLFYNDCDDADVRLAQALLTPQVAEPSMVPVHLSSRYEAVPRVYIETVNDHAVPLEKQRELYSRKTWERVFTLTTSHSPFFSQPDALMQCLLAVA